MRPYRLIPLLLLAACESDPLASAARGLEVDASVSGAQPRTLVFEVENRGSRTVYMDACDHRVIPVVQREVGGGWEDTNAAMCMIVDANPFALEPGATTQGSVQVGLAGAYRVGVRLRTEPWGRREELVASERVTIAQ